jgi:hypothetical protein
VESPSGTPPAVPRSEDEVIEESANQGVDPATVTVGKDGMYQGEDQHGVLRTLFEDDARDFAAAQVIQNAAVHTTEYDCSDGSCVTGQTYEFCRANGFDHTHCTGLTSELSYEYHRYGPDREDEERASWFPLDAEIDKEGAWSRKLALNEGDVWPCEHDYEGGFGAKCNGSVIECDTDSFCGDGRWCFHKQDGSSECRPRNPVMNVCNHKNKWGEQTVYPQGMTHAEAMNQGICPFPGTYLTAVERRAKAAADAQRAASQAGVTAVEATSTQQSGSGASMADILANSAAIGARSAGSSDLINRLASQTASSVGSQIRESGLIAASATPSSPTPTAGGATTQGADVSTLAQLVGAVQSAPAGLRRKRGLGGVSPIALYMGGR